MDEDKELTHSPETEKYFEGIVKKGNPEKHELARRRVRIASGVSRLGVDIPSTFAGSIPPVCLSPIYYTSNEIEDKPQQYTCSSDEIENNSQQEMTRTLSRPKRTYWRGNKNK